MMQWQQLKLNITHKCVKLDSELKPSVDITARITCVKIAVNADCCRDLQCLSFIRLFTDFQLAPIIPIHIHMSNRSKIFTRLSSNFRDHLMVTTSSTIRMYRSLTICHLHQSSPRPRHILHKQSAEIRTTLSNSKSTFNNSNFTPSNSIRR